jgi:hypothetical protein
MKLLGFHHEPAFYEVQLTILGVVFVYDYDIRALNVLASRSK